MKPVPPMAQPKVGVADAAVVASCGGGRLGTCDQAWTVPGRVLRCVPAELFAELRRALLPGPSNPLQLGINKVGALDRDPMRLGTSSGALP